MTVMFSPQNS